MIHSSDNNNLLEMLHNAGDFWHVRKESSWKPLKWRAAVTGPGEVTVSQTYKVPVDLSMQQEGRDIAKGI